MLSRSKNSLLEETKSVATSNDSSPVKKLLFLNNLSPLTTKRRPPLSKLASLPFRYAFDGFSRQTSQLTKQNTIPSPTNTLAGFTNDTISAQQHFSSSSLSGRCNSSHNGDCSTASEISEENLGMIRKHIVKKQNSISSSDFDDFKSSANDTNQQIWDTNISDSTNMDLNNQSLPIRSTESDILVANLKRYAIRRHHSAPQSDAKWLQAKRKAIVVQMYDTEKSYVEALKILVTKYYLPLKEKDIVERNLINDIFYKVPEIHVHHELLLSSLKSKFEAWDSRQTVGDILNIFAKQSVVETYISFVNNYRTSQEAIRICKDQSSLFSKFVEQQAKDHRGKLNLKDLIIQPVQRIPRYELYIKDFLKCTPTNHQDYQLLLKAQKEIHNLAEKIDQVHKEFNESYGPDSQSVLQIIQDLIENLDDLATAYRYYIRHDMITIVSSSGTKKDRCIFLFSDLIILTSCKRRSGNINKRTNSLILNSPIGKQYLENIKHKFIMKIQLEDVDITGGYLSKKLSIEKEYLEDDLTTITRINELAKMLAYPHQNLDECIKEITLNITRQLNCYSLNNESNLNSNLNNLCGLPNSANSNSLTINSVSTNNSSSNNIINLNGAFIAPSTPEITENKSHSQLILTINTNERVEVLKIMFSNTDQRANWEKCFFEAKKNFFESTSRKPATFLNVIAIPRNRSGVQFTCASARTHLVTNDPNDVWICSTDGQMGQICILNSVPELSVSSCNTVCSSRITCIQCVPPYRLKHVDSNGKKLTEQQSEFNDYQSENQSNETNILLNIEKRHFLRQISSNLEPDFLVDYDSSDDDDIDSQSGTEELNNQSNSVQSSSNIPLFTSNYDLKHSTMWIGNDDGSLHIFQFSDSAVRTIARKNRITKQFSSGVQSLLYMDNKVFVSLKNGELAIFKRNFSIWNYDSYAIKTISQNSFNCMISVAGKLWCAGENEIIVLSPNLISIEHHFIIDGEKSVLIATSGPNSYAVWVACQTNLDLKLYHATKYVLLAEINIRQCVASKLNGLDELIKVHKLSCLRITSIYVCKDTLWIGTSAGIICTVKIPHINNTTNKLTTALSFNAINHGHFGPVRFITSVEIAKNQTSSPYNSLNITDFNYKDTSYFYKTIVMSGGEGYEEYKSNQSINIGSISNNSTNVNTLGQGQTANSDNQLNLNTTNSINSCNNSVHLYSNNSTGATLQSQNSFASSTYAPYLDESSGKDDLINYVITWEL